MKKEVKTRSITGTKAVKYAELANKMVMLNLVSPIEEEATNYAQDGYNNYDDNIQRIIEEAFKSGATWMQEKFLKEL